MKSEKYYNLPNQTLVEDHSTEVAFSENQAYTQTMETLIAVANECNEFSNQFIKDRTNLVPIVSTNSLDQKSKPTSTSYNPEELIRYSVSFVPANSPKSFPALPTENKLQSKFVDPTWNANTKLRINLIADRPYNGKEHANDIRPVVAVTASGLIPKEVRDKNLGTEVISGNYPTLGTEGISVLTAYPNRNDPAGAAKLMEKILLTIYPLIDTTKHQPIAVPATQASGWRQRLLGRKS